MTDLVVRRLLIDLETGIPRRWAGDDSFRTAFFNALSMSFPVGEQFFIDSVRAGLDKLPPEDRLRLAPEAQGFIGQEATHRRIHALFNGHLAAQGHVNAWEGRIQRRLVAVAAGADPRHVVAATAATEHFTAIFAEWLLTHPAVLDGAEPRLRTMWLWHCAEESEHRSTAFDLYRALGGNEAWRLRWFRRVTLTFLTDLFRQTLRNLWHDGALFQWRTWRSAARDLFGDKGLVRLTFKPWRAYFAPGFHPRQQDDSPSRQWLRDNAAAYSVVGR